MNQRSRKRPIDMSIRIEELDAADPRANKLFRAFSLPHDHRRISIRNTTYKHECAPLWVNHAKLASRDLLNRLALRENQSRQDQARRRTSEETKQNRDNQQTSVNGLSHRNLPVL